MSDVDLPEAPDQGEPEKKGLLSRGVGAVKQVSAQAQAQRAEKIKNLDDRLKADQEALKAQRQALLDRGYELYEYRVIPIKSTLIGDKMDVSQVEGTINQWAAQGWHVRSVVETQVAGRVGPGGVGGLIILFERRLTQA